MPKIVTVGEILVEIMAEEKGQSFSETGHFHGPFPSGAPAIFIDQASRMGVDSGIVAKIGNDAFGDLNYNRLKQDGVDVSQIKRDESRLTGIAFVTYDKQGDRKFLYHFADSAAGWLMPDEIDEDYIASAAYLHVMGCSLMASERIAASVIKALSFAKKHDVTVTFDPNIRPELFHEESTRQLIKTVLDQSAILLTGVGEIKELTGNSDAEAAAAALAGQGKLVVLKNSSKPVKVYNKDTILEVPPFPAAEVDPTGAGDCFDGAFLAALCQQKTLKEAAIYACAAGALAVQKQGPMEGAAAKEEIEALLKASFNER